MSFVVGKACRTPVLCVCARRTDAILVGQTHAIPIPVRLALCDAHLNHKMFWAEISRSHATICTPATDFDQCNVPIQHELLPPAHRWIECAVATVPVPVLVPVLVLVPLTVGNLIYDIFTG